MPLDSYARTWSTVAGPKLHAAATREAKRRKISRAQLVRDALAALIGDSSLAESRPAGRPPAAKKRQRR